MSAEIEARLTVLEARIAEIEARNARVEREKAWETSALRRSAILALTYVTVCLVLAASGVEGVLLGAVIPTLGFFLSTLSLPVLKRSWVKDRFK